jgi:hypothetical protein
MKSEWCKEVGCERKTNDPSGLCEQHRSPSEVRVNISARDFEWLSDCDDIVSGLLERVTGVQLLFAPTDLAWLRERLSHRNTGWYRVKLKERRESGAVVMALNHRRGLAPQEAPASGQTDAVEKA